MLDLNKAAGMVPNASEHGYAIDHMLQYCHWFMTVLFVGWISYFLFTIWRFHRSRNPKADYHGVQSKASAHLEFSVVLIEAVLLLGFGLPLWGIRVTEDGFPKSDDRIEVRAIAEQFLWNFHYPGADGVFGRQRPDFISGSNPIGLDPNDPAGKDDLVVRNEFHLMDHKPAKIEITSKDVIHGFQLQHMRISQDAIPGSRVPVWFKPIKTGEFELVCSQLCGSGHYAMRGILKVDSKADYETWIKETTALQHPESAAPAAAPAPAAGAPAAPAAPAAK